MADAHETHPGAEPGGAGSSPGTPVGRRVVLGLIGLAAVGVALGSRVSSAINTIAENDPTGLTGLIPGGGRFRFYSVAGPVDDVPPARYRLRVDGLVPRPATLSYEDLSALPQTELVRDVQCVTGWRVPAVRWTGVLLRDLLAHVGVTPAMPEPATAAPSAAARPGSPGRSAGAVLFGSFDGVYTESLTMEQALRDDVLVALSLDGAPISNEHGGPVRLYVAPMYFYKSIKWLDRIEVADRVDPGYWEERGYDVDAWVGQSNGRTDVPTS